MSFDCKLYSGLFFNNLVKTISSFGPDGPIEISKEGISTRLISDNRELMIELFLSKHMFKFYHYNYCDDSPKVELKLSFSDLNKMIPKLKKSDEVHIKYDSVSPNRLVIDTKNSEFLIPLLEEVTCENMNLMTIESDTELSMYSNDLADCVNEIAKCSNCADFNLSNNALTISAESDRYNVIKNPYVKVITNNLSSDEYLKYRIFNLSKIIKAKELVNNITINFTPKKDDTRIMLVTFTLHNNGAKSYVKYYLGPEIENTSDDSQDDNESDNDTIPDNSEANKESVEVNNNINVETKKEPETIATESKTELLASDLEQLDID